MKKEKESLSEKIVEMKKEFKFTDKENQEDLKRMKKEKESLSEKRKELLNYLIEQFGEKSLIPQDILRVVKEQDKEFIKRVLDKKRRYLPTKDWVVNINDIIELAGEKLK